MAFSPWQMLSPVHWAKWTWSAVRGGGEGGEEEAEEEEEKSLSCSSDSEGNFETPEAETPVHAPLKDISEEPLDNSPSKRAELLENEQLISKTIEHPNRYRDKNSNQHEITSTCSVAEKNNLDQLNNEVVKQLANLQISEEATQKAPTGQPTLGEGQTLPSDALDTSQEALSEEQMVVTTEEVAEPQTASESAPVKGKPKKNRPSSLKMMADHQEPEEDEIPVPKVAYNFNPDEYNDNVNPFVLGGSKLQNSPPAASTIKTDSEIPDAKANLEETTGPVMKMEFDFTDNKENGDVKKPMPRKLGKKLGSKLTPKKQKPVAKPIEHPENSTTQNLDDVPISKSSYNSDPSKWDDPDFNPFNSSTGCSPSLPKGSYSFNTESFDDSIDPFKPSKTLALAPSEDTPLLDKLTEDLESQKLELPIKAEGKARMSPKKTKSRLITTSEQVRFLCFLLGACKVKKYENQSLILDICGQEDEPVTAEAHREGHATDEEKLASTTSNQKQPPTEVKGDNDDEFFECSNAPESTLAKKHPAEGLEKAVASSLAETESCSPYIDPAETKSKLTGNEGQGKGSPVFDTICINEADKEAVLTLIREEIISKEIETNEWKRKYEESRQEVFEMRKIVAEYEKTISQMIEDEQRTAMSSQQGLQQLTLEKEQAISDLNSVERSLSELFRRYENMKGVLEGYKKNEEVLKRCAQEYLARVKQEEQRYQTLKIHAEEKLDKANEDIAQVRSKANSEAAAFHASLRKEQMKVDSLERALQQKNQEIEELTKICDELIAKLGRSD
ncbi:transforming acidic coiled-coil-containing protein 1-like isoform X1 [Polyodon spathula]|uniref:transforming acidic coiled-coil-containing protein 1-like isoform X1 n=1 Tax=Polyodon spathula TaxID=7913 RepID=UPI001B7DFD87|nr:transforming acidic coiled-coil-containing protein 1-like isoform X1 [Polyodon spathula]